MNLGLMFSCVKFAIWLILNIKEFVLDAEARDPAPGKGKEKKAAIVEAVKWAAKVAGMADDVLDKIESTGLIESKIDSTVKSAINGDK